MKLNLPSALALLTILPFSSLVSAETTIDFYLNDKAKYQDVIIQSVLSPDTIELKSGEKIHLIGLRAPERLRNRKPVEYDEYGHPIKSTDKEESVITPVEEAALKFTQELLMNKHVRLEFDDEKRSPEYATYAYVFLLEDNIFANTEILRQGYAYLQIIPPNLKYAEKLRAAYREARSERRGLQNE